MSKYDQQIQPAFWLCLSSAQPFCINPRESPVDAIDFVLIANGWDIKLLQGLRRRQDGRHEREIHAQTGCPASTAKARSHLLVSDCHDFLMEYHALAIAQARPPRCRLGQDIVAKVGREDQDGMGILPLQIVDQADRNEVGELDCTVHGTFDPVSRAIIGEERQVRTQWQDDLKPDVGVAGYADLAAALL
jgi:hypothetical protein